MITILKWVKMILLAPFVVVWYLVKYLYDWGYETTEHNIYKDNERKKAKEAMRKEAKNG